MNGNGGLAELKAAAKVDPIGLDGGDWSDSLLWSLHERNLPGWNPIHR